MKLYYLKGACSLASYISLIEAGQKFEAYAIDRATKKTADGKDFNTINAKGYAPALQLDNGEVLTENVAVLSYIASLDKSGKLGPAPGNAGYFRLLEWLGYINSEVHKNFGPLFNPASSEDVRAGAKANLARRLGYIEERLGDKPYLTGNDFTVADAYLYVVLSWRDHVGVDISAFPKLTAFYERARSRPAVQQARKSEGLPA
ncbi:MAG: glutathione transferase GstA [Steroidobacteraceae bacterium]